jgi:TIR domain
MLTGIIRNMARCTAPTRGHHTASGRAACPACGGRSGGYGYGYGSSYPSYTPSYAPSYSSSVSIGGGRSSSGGSGGSARPRWSRAGSSVAYTTNEVRALTPIRETIEKQVPLPEGRDYFLCHAWDDRAGVAKELYELLQSRGVSVWFSERDISLGTPFLREIDKGLAKSKAGIVLVTPALLLRLKGESIADKELSVLLAREQLIPVVHGTTYDALREISPMLASRNGLNTADNLMADVAAKLAELVAI